MGADVAVGGEGAAGGGDGYIPVGGHIVGLPGVTDTATRYQHDPGLDICHPDERSTSRVKFYPVLSDPP